MSIGRGLWISIWLSILSSLRKGLSIWITFSLPFAMLVMRWTDCSMMMNRTTNSSCWRSNGTWLRRPLCYSDGRSSIHSSSNNFAILTCCYNDLFTRLSIDCIKYLIKLLMASFMRCFHLSRNGCCLGNAVTFSSQSREGLVTCQKVWISFHHWVSLCCRLSFSLDSSPCNCSTGKAQR